MKLQEIADRLKSVADAELFAINELERFAARPGQSPAIELTVVHVRRQAEALGQAHRILVLLASHPGLAEALASDPGA